MNEQTNGLVRQYLPKGRRLDDLSKADVEKIEVLLNNRPRKVLEYETPLEVFNCLTAESLNVALAGLKGHWKRIDTFAQEMGDSMIRGVILYPRKDVVYFSKNKIVLSLSLLWQCESLKQKIY